jgi:Ca2+-binding RTX toxin-like protein
VAGRTSAANEATENIGVARFEGGAWRSLPRPGQVNTGLPVRLVDVRGAPWILYRAGGRLVVDAFGEGAPDLPDGRDPQKPERGDCGFLKRGGRDSDALVGTAGRDTLFGLGGDDWLFGRRGRDCLYGGAGADRIYGGPHTDFLFGGDGRDRLHGGKGHDVLYGRAGSDTIFPEHGRDDVAAGSGNDTIRAVRGGVDHVNCGRGYDVLYASRGDGWRNCERVVIRR